MKQKFLCLFKPKLTAIAYAVLHCLTFPSWANEENAPIYITADHVDGISEHMARAKGNVVIKRGALRANSEWARYDTSTAHLWAGDTVTVDKEGDIVIGKQLDMITDTYLGKLDTPIYLLHDRLGRGDATQLLFTGEDRYLLKKGRFTTCDLGDDSWYIQGKHIDLDFTKHHGVAQHATFEFKGTPIFYSPWLDFPLDGNRKSGFLAPLFGSNSNSGVNIGLPYYWNIAPNYDATLTPQIYSKRGEMLGGEFRYLQPNYRGAISGEFLPNDHKAHRDRYSWKVLHQQNLGAGFQLHADLQGASDNHYFTDLSSNIQASSTTNLPRDILLRYQSNSWWSATIRSQQYQTLQSTTSPIVKPYARLPQVTFNGSPPIGDGLIMDISGEVDRFKHPTLTTGNRFIVYPSLSAPVESIYGFIHPKIGVHTTVYGLDKDLHAKRSQYTRILPIFSLDTSLIFERDFRFAKKEMVQTLEPRLYYVYIPYKDQSALPNFDSSELDFNFSQMFSENQFSGGDRINNANQLTAALSTRFYETRTGFERLRFGVGQRFYFSDQRVTLSAPARPVQQTHSDMIIGASTQLWDNIAIGTSWQYSAQNKHMNKSSVDLAWSPILSKVLNVRYRFDRTQPDLIRQLDFSGQWPLSRGWYAVGRYNYSLADRKALDTIAGLQYNAGCWGLQFVMQRYVSDNNRMNTSFYIMLNLRGFNGIGNNPIGLLQERIAGYAKLN